MKRILGASLAAMLCLSAGVALAGSAVLSNDMTAFEGPGDNYRPVLHLVAGQRIDVLECNFKQWCQIEHDGQLGWVHASLAAPKKVGSGGAAGLPEADSGDAASGGGTAGGTGGGKTPKFSKVGGEITQTGDGGGSSGGSGGVSTGRQRASASGGGSFESTPPAMAASEASPPPSSGDIGTLTTTPSCFRC